MNHAGSRQMAGSGGSLTIKLIRFDGPDRSLVVYILTIPYI